MCFSLTYETTNTFNDLTLGLGILFFLLLLSKSHDWNKIKRNTIYLVIQDTRRTRRHFTHLYALFCFFSLRPKVMVKREDESLEAALKLDPLGNRCTTIQRKPAFTVYFTLLGSVGMLFVSRLTALATVAANPIAPPAADSWLSRAAAAIAELPDSQ